MGMYASYFDMISYHKGRKYLTIVRDLDMGKVIWIGIGRKKETLDTFFKELGKKKCRKIGNPTAFVVFPLVK